MKEEKQKADKMEKRTKRRRRGRKAEEEEEEGKPRSKVTGSSHKPRAVILQQISGQCVKVGLLSFSAGSTVLL